MKFASNFKMKALAGAALVAGTFAAPAHAIVTAWEYQVDSAFSAWAATGGGSINTSDPNANLGGLPTTLSWGIPTTGGQSSLSVTGTVTNPPNLITNGAAVDGAVLTHDNQTIVGNGQYLDSATLISQLALFALPPGNDGSPEQLLGPAPFFIEFRETPNSTPCAADGATVCPDIFVLLNPGNLVQEFFYDNADGDGLVKYTVTLILEGLETLSAAECQAATGSTDPCVGLITEEFQENSFQTSFTITAELPPEVPEPGTLALLGALAGGFGVWSRRRKA